MIIQKYVEVYMSRRDVAEKEVSHGVPYEQGVSRGRGQLCKLFSVKLKS